MFGKSQFCVTREWDDFLPCVKMPFSTHARSFKAVTQGNTERIVYLQYFAFALLRHCIVVFLVQAYI